MVTGGVMDGDKCNFKNIIDKGKVELNPEVVRSTALGSPAAGQRVARKRTGRLSACP